MIETDAMHQPFEVDHLDGVGVLDLFDDAEQLDRVAQLRKLRLAYQWARVNPVVDEIDAANWGAARSGSEHDCEDPIGGEGSPLVLATAVTTLAARQRISLAAAQSLMADTLDLVHRLPLIHARVEALELATWKARRVASMTRTLSAAAAAWVDQELAGRITEVGFVTIERVIQAAVAVFHPDRLDDEPKSAESHWRVELSHPIGAKDNSYLDVTADTLDLVGFHDLVCAVAEALRRDGDEDTLDQRKAKALGLIGRGEHHDLLAQTATAATAATADPDDAASSTDPEAAGAERGESSPRRWQRRRPGAPTRIYVHVKAEDLDPNQTSTDPASTDGSGRVRIGHLEGIGPVTVERIREWSGTSSPPPAASSSPPADTRADRVSAQDRPSRPAS